jgi:precorrin-6A/cobalt-precorrin-6A reductase
MPEAVAALGNARRSVFLTVGRLELHHFAHAPQHRYLLRTIEPVPADLGLPDMVAIRNRGPFAEEAEAELMRRHGIDIVVTKNSGGTATYAKIAAARRLGIPVVLVRQPEKPTVPTAASAKEALDWILRHARTP